MSVRVCRAANRNNAPGRGGVERWEKDSVRRREHAGYECSDSE